MNIVMQRSMLLFSLYRKEIMGIATIMIIVCHSTSYVGSLPELVQRSIGSLGYACDMFLFLSGIGMWNSMKRVRSKQQSVLIWLRNRYIRIIVPFVVIVLPVCLYNGNGVFETIIRLTGFDYLFFQLGLWFVSCILLLYILTPVLDIAVRSNMKWFYVSLFICVFLIIGCVDWGQGQQMKNLQFVCNRFPCYVLGYTIATDVMSGRKISLLWMIVVPLIIFVILYYMNHRFSFYFSLFWLQGIPAVALIAIVLSLLKCSILNMILSFVGSISLESYLTNVLVVPILKRAVMNIFPCIDGWAFYTFAIVICIVLAYFVNVVSKTLINKLS